MTIETLGIPIAFILVVAGLLWFVIYAKGWWWTKVIYMAIVLAFGFTVWGSIESYRGWPTKEPTPQRFVLLWAEIREPEPKLGDDGAIYIWLVTYEKPKEPPGAIDYKPSYGEPRSFRLPYSRGLHKQMEQAKGMIREGKAVIMERRKGKPGFGKPGEGKPGEGEDGEGRNGPGRRPGGYGERPYDEFFFYEMPPPKLPNKTP